MTLLAERGAWPAWLRAAAAGWVRRVGVLMAYTEDNPEDQRASPHQKRFVSQAGSRGRNLQSAYRWYAGHRAGEVRGEELVGLKPDVILVGATIVWCASQETRSIPLVFAAVTDPIGLGLVESLARPGGTPRASLFRVLGRHQAPGSAPADRARARRIALMYTPTSPVYPQYLAAIDCQSFRRRQRR